MQRTFSDVSIDSTHNTEEAVPTRITVPHRCSHDETVPSDEPIIEGYIEQRSNSWLGGYRCVHSPAASLWPLRHRVSYRPALGAHRVHCPRRRRCSHNAHSMAGRSRYVKIRADGLMTFFTSEESLSPRESFQLGQTTVIEVDSDGGQAGYFPFRIDSEKGKMLAMLRTQSREERSEWIAAIRDAAAEVMERASQVRTRAQRSDTAEFARHARAPQLARVRRSSLACEA